MSEDSQPTEQELRLSAAAAAEWNRHVESVLRGVAHALNNRAAALAALIELTSEPAEEPAVLREILGSEQRRVSAIVQTVRAMGMPQSDAEAVLPADVAADVRVVLEQHPDLRDGAVQIDATHGSPVRVPRWAFARALLALAAGMTGAARATPRRLAITTEGDWVIVAGEAERTTPASASALAAELAAHMGGEPLAGRYGIRVPTLAALRRREGR